MRVERALHKEVRWSLAIANNDLHKRQDPARGVDRAVVTLHAELPLTPLNLRTLITTCGNRRIHRLLRLVLGALLSFWPVCPCNRDSAELW
jgi:hypothetical protein